MASEEGVKINDVVYEMRKKMLKENPRTKDYRQIELERMQRQMDKLKEIQEQNKVLSFKNRRSED